MTRPSRENGHTVEKIVRACASKLRYPDELTARAAGMHYITHTTGPDRPEALWWYRCVHCRGVHLTKNDNGRKYKVNVFS